MADGDPMTTLETASQDWMVLASPASVPAEPDPPSLRRIVVQAVALVAVVIAVVATAAVLVSQRVAKQQAVHDVAQMTDVLAQSIVQPALLDTMANDPVAAARLDAPVRNGILTTDVVRVKLWTPQGLVLYSDEPRLVGRRFTLDDEAQAALTAPRTEAGISDLSRPENAFETSGRLLEVYRPVWTPSGKPLLFEAYFRYSVVTDRSHDLWRGFSGLLLSTLAAALVLLTPLAWTSYRRARAVQAQRERLMQRAVDASNEERRRIAATLHDGVVQQLAGTAFGVAGAAERARTGGDRALADQLDSAAAELRNGVAGMRSLLVDIYPPSLSSGGLAPALNDLARTATGSPARIDVTIDPDAAAPLDAGQQRALFRIAHEGLRNAIQHSAATRIELDLVGSADQVRLEIRDDGLGFDPRSASVEGHFGLSLMADAALAARGTLGLSTRPGGGTRIRIEVPAT